MDQHHFWHAVHSDNASRNSGFLDVLQVFRRSGNCPDRHNRVVCMEVATKCVTFLAPGASLPKRRPNPVPQGLAAASARSISLRKTHTNTSPRSATMKARRKNVAHGSPRYLGTGAYPATGP